MAEDYPRTLMELEQRFSTEEACCEYLASLRWPSGFVCPHCQATEAWRMAGVCGCADGVGIRRL